MSDKKYKVGVVIPTYNRKSIVEKCVLRLLSFPLEFDITVSDNDSSDGTFECLKKIKDPRLNLIKQDFNVGASYNIHLSYLNSRAKYAILISDEEDVTIEAIQYLEAIDNCRPDVSVIFGSGIVLNNKDKRYKDEVFIDYKSALFRLAFQTRYMSGITFNIDNYKKALSNVSFEQSVKLFDTYSFMVAAAILMCSGSTITSNIVFYKQARKAKTSATNNAIREIYYYEPKGRMLQFECWMNCILGLPFDDDSFKQKLIIKQLFDNILLSYRVLSKRELELIADIASDADYQMFSNHIKDCSRESILSSFLLFAFSKMKEAGIILSNAKSIEDGVLVDNLDYYKERLNEVK